MLSNRKHLAMGIFMAQSILVAPAVQAQLEEIIVTAERREASLQDTSIAITAFSEDTLRELGVSNYLDLGDFAPNVMMHEMPGKAGGAISIRGFKNAETISTFEPKVGLYLDGVILAKGAGSVFDILDLERVEILRGPQGTLYGRNTAGGAVNFITKKPDYEIGGSLSTTLGNYDQRDIKATLNLPLVADTLALKATVASLTRDGFWKNTLHSETLGDKDRKVAHIQLLWEPADNLSLLYSYDRTDIDDGMYPLAPVAFRDTSPAYPLIKDSIQDGGRSTRDLNLAGTYMNADIDGHSLTVDWAINDNLSLVSVTALRAFDVDNIQDSDHLPITLLDNYSRDKVETLTQEIRLVGNSMDERLNYVIGGFYMDEDLQDVVTALTLGSGMQLLTNVTAQNDIWALFGEATYDITEKLDFTFGLRYTEEDKSMTRVNTTVMPTGVSIPLQLPDASRTFTDVSGTVGLSYNWTPDVMTYFKVSKGYVSGGFNPRSPNNEPATFLKGYDEETLINYEIGWKATLLDNRLRLNGAIFHIDYSDLQVNQLTPGGQNNIDNAGDATMRGLELEVAAWLTDNIEIGGSYGYLDPEYKSYIDAGGIDLSNNHFAHAPDNTFNAYARFIVPNFQGVGDLTFRVDYAWVDDHYLLTANDAGLIDGNQSPSYDFVNAR
ncbi:MAG TPA: TonB-dependent receptor, partial [Pseudomonadaceae bacterium]|nr:TonB-dependent receptor [Pseudomonadaceae bacterium]